MASNPSGFLILEDGSLFPGKAFGYPPPTANELPKDPIGVDAAGAAKIPAGELIFNTGMAGYHEILTDQSYSGQIVVMTYPHIGNYGTADEWTEFIAPTDPSQDGLKAAGLAVRSLYRGPIPEGRTRLDDFLTAHKTSGIADVDTRALTLRIRRGGNPVGLIVAPRSGNELSRGETDLCLAFLRRFPRMEGRDLVTGIGTGKPRIYNQDGSPHVCLVDCGVKGGIIEDLIALGCRVSLVGNGIGAGELRGMNPDAVFFSNGPGDPAVLEHLVDLARSFIAQLPVLGICLGHQIICLALGAKTFKMKFGHHGVNNPVKDEETGKVLITSQNHGFAVEESSLPDDCRVWFRNVNDGTVEGIAHEKLPILCVQFHPEARPGPRDSGWIFRRFLEAI